LDASETSRQSQKKFADLQGNKLPYRLGGKDLKNVAERKVTTKKGNGCLVPRLLPNKSFGSLDSTNHGNWRLIMMGTFGSKRSEMEKK
jgi:hypothetical protein